MSSLPATGAFLGERSLALVGAGNIGKLLATQLTEAGFPTSRLVISCRGTPTTIEALTGMGFGACIQPTETAVRDAKVVFISVRAQELPTLRGMPFCKDALIVVMTTGISFAALQAVTGVDQANIIRAQTCGHHIIEARRAIVAMCPRDDPVTSELFGAMKYSVLPPIRTEPQVHMLSCLICTPAARVCLKTMQQDVTREEAERFIQAFSTEPLDCLGHVLEWSMRESEPLLWHEGRGDVASYVNGFFTKGGLTEAVCLTILGGMQPATPQGYSQGRYFAGLATALDRCMTQVRANDQALQQTM